jgi:hypothetical protein
MITKKKYETEGLDNYLRLFPKVMRTEITLLQKYILCDVISRNIQGEPYYKVSATLAEELGNYKKKTIQTAFQWLNSNGYINTEPYNDGKHKDDLREVEIIQIEKWIYTDEQLNKMGFKILPTEKKTKDENYAWIMKNRKEKRAVSPNKASEFIKDVESDDNSENELDEVAFGVGENGTNVIIDKSTFDDNLKIMKFSDLEDNPNIGKVIIEKIKSGENLDYEMVIIDFEDGGSVVQNEVIKIPNSSKYYAKSMLMLIDKTLFSDEMI